MENIDNIVIEHLKKIQAEQSSARERDAELLRRLSQIELSIARLSRDETSNFTEIIEDRHAIDRLRERLDRIEQRLELRG